MRILFISRAWGQKAGGMERLSFELIEAISKRSDITCDLIVRQRQGRFGAIMFTLVTLPKAIWRARRADVVHLGDPVLALHGWLIKRIWHKPVAVTIHGLDLTFPHQLYQLYLKIFARFDLYLPISRHVEQLLLQHSIAISPIHIQCISPGINDSYYNPTLSRHNLAQLLKQLTNYHLPTSHTVLFTAGRLIKRKGHAWFIREVLPSLPPHTVYLVAGDGPEYETIKQTTVKAKLNLLTYSRAGNNNQPHSRDASPCPTVILLGRVTDDQLKILYNTIDAFIQPNIAMPGDSEGFGLVLLEAALCQRAIFAANLEGISDAIHQQKNGVLLPTEDAPAWQSALTNYLQNPSLSPLARQYTLDNHSWPKQAALYVTAFKSLI